MRLVASLAQSVERQTFNLVARGSSPLGGAHVFQKTCLADIKIRAMTGLKTQVLT